MSYVQEVTDIVVGKEVKTPVLTKESKYFLIELKDTADHGDGHVEANLTITTENIPNDLLSEIILTVAREFLS